MNTNRRVSLSKGSLFARVVLLVSNIDQSSSYIDGVTHNFGRCAWCAPISVQCAHDDSGNRYLRQVVKCTAAKGNNLRHGIRPTAPLTPVSYQSLI